MLEVMQFYVSGFWVWVGLTVGLSIICGGVGAALSYLAVLAKGR